MTDIQRWVRPRLGGILAWILLAIISGIFGTFGANLWSTATRLISWAFAIAVSAASLLVVVIVYLWFYARGVAAQSDAAFAVAERLISSDETLLRFLPGLVNNGSANEAAGRLLREYLQEARQVFEENVARASILRPKSDAPEFLAPWAHYQMPDESLARTRFYIGPDEERKRGVAGKAYVMRQVHIVHIRQNAAGRWEPDDPDYQVFDTTRADPPYRSFVAVPILGPERDVCLGVLCFDSPILTAFDSEDVADLLLALGTRIAAVIRISEALTTPRRPRRATRVASTP